MPLSSVSLVCLALSAFLIGFSKTSVGGLGILVVPLVAFAISGPESTGMLLPMLIMADIIAVLAYHQSCLWPVFLRIFPTTAIGVVLGYLIMDRLPHEVFAPILGLIILIMLTIGWFIEKKTISANGNHLLTWFVGICAGISTMVANAAGPLMGIYLLQQGLPKKQFVGTRSWFFLLLNLYKLPFSAHLGFVSGSSLKINLMMLPLILIGAVIGVKILKFINIVTFRWIVRSAAIASAFKLLLG